MELFLKHPAAFGDTFLVTLKKYIRQEQFTIHGIVLLYVELTLFPDWFFRLTAFIAKELSRSRDIIDVTDSYIEEAVSYLISKQKADGSWNDPNPLYDKGMKVQAAQRIKKNS